MATDQCKPGACIVGEIKGVAITEKQWPKKYAAFQKEIDDWNEKTKRFAIPHPGFCYKANFCPMCGHRVQDFHAS